MNILLIICMLTAFQNTQRNDRRSITVYEARKDFTIAPPSGWSWIEEEYFNEETVFKKSNPKSFFDANKKMYLKKISMGGNKNADFWMSYILNRMYHSEINQKKIIKHVSILEHKCPIYRVKMTDGKIRIVGLRIQDEIFFLFILDGIQDDDYLNDLSSVRSFMKSLRSGAKGGVFIIK